MTEECELFFLAIFFEETNTYLAKLGKGAKVENSAILQ